MHSAVMQNKKYVRFAQENTVEVLSLGGLDRAIQEGDRKAATYRKKGPDGVEREYMEQWPSLTAEMIQNLRSGKAGQYNKTGKIPYTAIIDPWTEEEIQSWGGGQSANTIEDAVIEARKKLYAEHGPGITRQQIHMIDAVIAEAEAEVADGDFRSAMRELERARKKTDDWPEVLTDRIEAGMAAVTAAAKKRLDEVLAIEEPVQKKRELRRLISKLRGLDALEEEAKGILRDL